MSGERHLVTLTIMNAMIISMSERMVIGTRSTGLPRILHHFLRRMNLGESGFTISDIAAQLCLDISASGWKIFRNTLGTLQSQRLKVSMLTLMKSKTEYQLIVLAITY